ncbi:glutathione S-transferase family protein [Paragemmobacter straminiformis]|uniref:Glutathione S-transferase family protein n=1 Tax=Paragemmobacter straminiformis TaxID=2045119 RepID=A0A842I6E2_9RHOB|nr:glutathione S-transferase family protein [Gemmobacter straminiformis]MBC2834947.1 glutathione S-transferase family protein [Gemmobacter straminiformis]
MLTLFHAPQSRSTRILTLIEEMGAADKITLRPVDIIRADGTGARDHANPHPDAKVPALDHDGTLVTESGAVMLYLTDLFPSPLAPVQGDAKRGAFLTWLFWYGSVMEPVMILSGAGLDHPWLAKTYRGMPEITARLQSALSRGPWLLGDTFTAADILIQSPFHWFKDAIPDDPLIRDWLARGAARPAYQRVMQAEAQRRAA